VGKFLLPQGTLIKEIAVWERYLPDEELKIISGVEFVSKKNLPQEARTFHVSPGGNDENSGLEAALPLKSIDKALDQVLPGDTVVLHPGVYYGPVIVNSKGLEDHPITIKADKPKKGRVIITCADPDIRQGKVRWTLEDPDLKLYSIPFKYNPARVLYSGVDLLPFPNLEGLKTFKLKDGYPGTFHGFFFAKPENKLYVRLHPKEKYGSTDPNKHLMCVSPRNAGGFNGTHIWQADYGNIFISSRGKTYINIEGLTLETPGAAGIIDYGDNVVVGNCWFVGCRFGVWGVRYTESKPESVIVENCDFHHYPAFDDMEEVIECAGDSEALSEKFSIYWWQRKGKFNDSGVMKNYETGIAGGVGRDWHIRSNYIHDAFEGLSCWGNSFSENLQVYGNKFIRIVDNALESENHARNMMIYNNVFGDVFEPISWQPICGRPWPGPVFVCNNVFYTTEKAQKLWPWTPGCFKIGAFGGAWLREHMGGIPMTQLKSKISKRFVFVPYPGFLVFNNTIYFPHGNLLTTPQPTSGVSIRDLVNFRFFNNIIVTGKLHKYDTFKGSLIEFYNNLAMTTSGKGPQTEIMAGLDGLAFSKLSEFKMKDPQNFDFQLLKDSPAIGRGTLDLDQVPASTDIGAIPFNSKWQMPGTGAAAKEDKACSLFEKLVINNTSLERLPSPFSGKWGFFSSEKTVVLKMPFPEKTGHSGTVSFWLRMDKEFANGPEAKKKSLKLLSIPKIADLTFNVSGSQVQLAWKWGKGMKVDGMITNFPSLGAPSWHHVMYSWDAEKGIFNAWIDGSPQRTPDTKIPEWDMKPLKELEIFIGELAVCDFSVSDKFSSSDDKMPEEYKNKSAKLLGDCEPEKIDLERFRGDLLYSCPMENGAQLNGWKMEGPGKWLVKDKWLEMYSTKPESPAGHIVFWCPENFPADFLAEWEIKLKSDYGLCIVFFCAKGREGEDIFDSKVPLRNGLFSDYINGAINCYHISYFANTPFNPGRVTCNMRKNHGFYLVSNGPAIIKGGDHSVHKLALMKKGGRIVLSIDGLKAIEFKDHGKKYGPRLEDGKIGLRQMSPTVAEYRNFKVYSLKK
jgi:hypothetical protein